MKDATDQAIDDGLPLRFWSTYKVLAICGMADEPGGAEYRRVFHEWQEAGFPADLVRFICHHNSVDSMGRARAYG